jgi:hypothetical protein
MDDDERQNTNNLRRTSWNQKVTMFSMKLLQFFKLFIPRIDFPNESNTIQHGHALICHVRILALLLESILLPLRPNPYT